MVQLVFENGMKIPFVTETAMNAFIKKNEPLQNYIIEKL